MPELRIVIKDELDGRVTIRVEPQGANLIHGRAKNLLSFLISLIDQIPQRVRNDIFDGAQISVDMAFMVKPRGS